jgi:hypothetical protein
MTLRCAARLISGRSSSIQDQADWVGVARQNPRRPRDHGSLEFEGYTDFGRVRSPWSKHPFGDRRQFPARIIGGLRAAASRFAAPHDRHRGR